MNVIGLIRIRNEAQIIGDTLDHLSEFCTGGVYVYDDDSTDDTVQICKNHYIVKEIIKGKKWSDNREKAEYENRQEVLETAQKYASNDDWFIYIDADERVDFDWNDLNSLSKNIVGINMNLFDFYITKEDTHKKYYERKYIGPEYRKILMLFRNTKYLKYYIPDQREVFLGYKGKIITKGYVKHYGKAVSIKQWEETCDYYSKSFPKYAKKWEARRGKAVHIRSDFGRELILWEEKIMKGVPLWKIELENTSITYRGKFYFIKTLVFIKVTIFRIIHIIL